MRQSTGILLACFLAASPANSISAEQGLSANMLQAEAAIGREEYGTAVEYLAAECDHGGSTGCYNLAVFIHEGIGGPRDLARAAALNQRACDLGNVDGCANLGTQLLTGDGVSVDRRKAGRLLEKSCRKESPTGCFGLALLREGLFGGMADMRRAASALESACRLGHGEACYRRGHQLAKVADVPGWQMATAWYTDACDAGNAAGCNALGVLASEGKGGPADGQKAVHFFKDSCEKGSATGCRNLGKLLDEGKLAPADAAVAAASLARALAIESGHVAGQRQPLP